MLFCVIDGPTPAQAQTSLDQALGKVQGVELRFDLFEWFDIEEIGRLIAPYRKELQFLFTLRAERQGGNFQGTEEERFSLLRQLCTLNPDYLDLEYDVSHEHFREFAERFPKTQLICSYHNFTQTPQNLNQLLASIGNPHAHIIKMACLAKTATDALAMLHCVRSNSFHQKLIGISMGEAGTISRILGPVIGNYFDYACLSKAVAPGQLTIEEMQHPYRYNQLNPQTALYGLIGYPINKSVGHLTHNAVFEKTQTNAVYVKMAVTQTELPEWIEWARQLSFKGLSVTMPLKEAIIPFLDGMTPSAERIQAVNTITIDQGKWIGHNTDGMGALNAIETKMPVKGKRLVICGAGGSAKAIAYEAVQRGAIVTILNRTASKAEHLATLFHCRGGGFSLFPEVIREGYDIIVNTIPEGELIDEQWILPEVVAMDIVYVPQDTPFLMKAQRKNCTLVYGYQMFVAQAIGQQQIWFPDRNSILST